MGGISTQLQCAFKFKHAHICTNIYIYCCTCKCDDWLGYTFLGKKQYHYSSYFMLQNWGQVSDHDGQ